MTQQAIITDYQQRAAAARQEADKYKKLTNTYSLLRLGIFALLGLAIYFGAVNDNFTVIAVSTVILVFAFLLLVAKQSIFEQKLRYFLDLKKVNENEIKSIETCSNLYDNGAQYSNEKHFYTSDLDIFGRASLFQLLNRAATSAGNNKLASWLNGPGAKDTILSRQEAVKELSRKNDWKLGMQTTLLFAQKLDANQLQLLFGYLKMPIDMAGEKWLVKYVRVAPIALLVLIIAAFFWPIAKSLAIFLALANLGIVGSKAGYIKKKDMLAGKIGATLSSFAVGFDLIEKENWEAAYNRHLAQILISNNTSGKIKELSTLINKLNYHLNMIVGVILNALLLWDIRQVIAIENWKRNNLHGMEEAFDVMADYEALMSLTSVAINYPEWSYPQIADGDGYTLTAHRIAHPLIPAKYRVANDYELNDTHKVDIITGSNMAGKSTFLRTMGINTVLALSGSPVCAQSMSLSVITMVSYMRIKDSLNESTSTFKAELDRLQMLLAAVKNEPKVFFLIDEMLRGTNSVDKYLGSKAVIEQLIGHNAVGMVATHDLQIAQLEQKYPDYVRNFYFDIQVKNGEMLFDYKMKHGECKTFNASLLLKQIGIEIDTDHP